MKQTLLFLFCSLFSFSLFSQCIPDETYRDSAIGVYPPPMSDENPDGGITESACIDAPYEFSLTVKIPESLIFGGNEVQLDSIVLETEGAVSGLPIGISYDCNPGDCTFTPEDTLGCVRLFGTATSANMAGDYMLGIETTIFSAIGAIPVTFPSLLIPGADGEYTLTLEPAGGTDCLVGTDDYLTKNIRVSNNPNPFKTVTMIEVYSDINESLDFVVFDMLGNVVHRRPVQILEGANNFEFDGTNLSNGIYTFSLSNKLGTISRKIVISR